MHNNKSTFPAENVTGHNGLNPVKYILLLGEDKNSSCRKVCEISATMRFQYHTIRAFGPD